MERELWKMTQQRLLGWVNNLLFSGIWASFSMENLSHERKKTLIGQDYEFIKNICKL